MPKKRHKDKARTASGRISRAYKGPARDNGHPDAQRHALALVNGSNNPALAYSLASVLHAHGILNRGQHAAAIQLRSLRARCFGTPLANSSPGRDPTEERVATNERRYAQAMDKLTPEQALAVVDVALDLRSPWMARAVLNIPPAADDNEDRRLLTSGLDVLADRS